MNLTSQVARRAGGGLALAAIAVLLPVTALAAPAAPSAPAAAGHRAVAAAPPACTSGHTRVWIGLPGDGTAGTTFY